MTSIIDRFKAFMNAEGGVITTDLHAVGAKVDSQADMVVSMLNDVRTTAVRTIHDVIADIDTTAALVVDLTTKQTETANAIAQAKQTLATLRDEFNTHRQAVEAKLAGA